MLKKVFLLVLLHGTCACLSAQTPAFSWVKPIYGANQTDALQAIMTDLKVDPSGNTYVTGEFTGQLNFGSGISLTGTSNLPTLFLVKYAPDGTPLWAKKGAPSTSLSGMIFQNSSKIAVDAAGNIFWCGNFFSLSVDFGDGVVVTRSCTNDCTEGFLLKLNTNGNVVFQKNIRGALGEQLHLAGVAADSAGRHYLTGTFTGHEIWLQGGANIGGLTTEGYFLGAYNVDGNAEWVAFQTDASAIPFAKSIAISSDGNRVVVVGDYDGGALDFSNGATVSSSIGTDNRFAVWYNTIGQPTGAGAFASSDVMDIYDIRVDQQYRLWAAGNYSGTLEWGGAVLAGPPASGSVGMVAVVSPGTPGVVAVSIPHTINALPVTSLTLGPNGAFFTGGLAGESVSVPGVGPTGHHGCLDVTFTSGIGTSVQHAIAIGGAGCERMHNLFGGSLMGVDANGGLVAGSMFEQGGSYGANSLNGNGLCVAKIGGVVSVQGPSAELNIQISPNPATDFVKLEFPENAEGRCRISSVSGIFMKEKPVQPQVVFDVSKWPAGIYLAEYFNKTGRSVEKLAIQR